MNPFLQKTSTQISWSYIQDQIATLPLYSPYMRIAKDLGDEWPTIERFNEVAASYSPNLHLNFVWQGPSSKRNPVASASLRGYIQLIAENQIVPMRQHSVHDLFNYLTFVLFPETKKQLMNLHHRETLAMIENGELKPRGGRGRSRLQDLMTLFDEGGSIAFGPDERDLIVFGHGILEQFILKPQRVRAFCWHYHQHRSEAQSLDVSEMDRLLANTLNGRAALTNSNEFNGQWIPDSLVAGANHKV